MELEEQIKEKEKYEQWKKGKSPLSSGFELEENCVGNHEENLLFDSLWREKTVYTRKMERIGVNELFKETTDLWGKDKPKSTKKLKIN